MERNRLLGVQYLRAIAALMVAYFHLTLQFPAYTPYLATHRWINTDFFQGAVPVFFVISGFVMYVSGIESQPARFASRRLARIVPLYWVLTLAVLALAIAKPGFLHTEIATGDVMRSLLFVPYFRAGSHEILPILAPGWSLDYEMFFYGLFALALFVPMRWRLAMMLLMLSGLFCIGDMVPAVRADAVGLAYTSGLLLLFGFGLILGWLYRSALLALPWPLAGAIAAFGGLYLLIASWSPEWVRGYIAPLSIVLGVVSLDAEGLTPRWPWLLALGDASYSIYLAHLFAFDLVEKVWQRLQATGMVAAIVYAALSLAAAVVLALGTYRLIERPAVAIFKRKQTPNLAPAV